MAGYLPDPAGCGCLPVRRGHSGPGRSDHGRRFALAAVRRYSSPAPVPPVGLALRAYAALAGVTVLNPLTVVY
jgi:hypothetical protein